MKENDLNGIKAYEYENDKIYQNRKIIRYLYRISLVVSVLSAIAYVIVNTVWDNWSIGLFGFYSAFFCGQLFIPLCSFLGMRKEYEKKPSELTVSEINKICKRFKSSVKQINRFPSASLIFAAIIPELMEICVGVILGWQSKSVHTAFYMLGYMFPSYLCIYIASVYSIKNYFNMKKEWATAPPPSAQLQPAQDNKAEMEEQKMRRKYEKLIEQCGVRFFIKYYKQIKLLPLRDVNVTENYTPVEKQERLLSAKKIIELDLTEFALNEIINTYSNVLDGEEIKQAKLLLLEVEQTK